MQMVRRVAGAGTGSRESLCLVCARPGFNPWCRQKRGEMERSLIGSVLTEHKYELQATHTW